MAFKRKEVERLLAETRRRCCICGSLHNVQVHHIIPKEQGGSDKIDNAIPLCPSCHDRVHVKPSAGRTTRDYTAEELRLHRDRMISTFKKIKGRDTSLSMSLIDDGTCRRSDFSETPEEIKEISLSNAARKDCDTLTISPEEAITFVKGEAKRHPLMFGIPFTSMPLVFGENVLMLSWHSASARIERVLHRQEAYPLNDRWSSCLGLYRKATLLPYRTQATDRLISSAEEKRTLSIFSKLIQETESYARHLKRHTGTVIRNIPDLKCLYDEAEFALENGDIGTGISRLEALLSSIHKLILRYAPQGKGSGHIETSGHFELAPADPGKISVLIVDDEPAIRFALMQYLRDNGFQCYEASGSREAMQFLVERDFDVIIIDLVMPNREFDSRTLDGRELVLAARQSGSRAKIVVFTAYAEMAMKSEVGTDKFPCDGMIIKSSCPTELLNIILDLLEPSNDKKK